MKVLRKDFFREIKNSRNRYLSLLFIVALGVAFFSGVRSAEPDMQLSADVFFDDTNFMDIRVLGTLGLTEDDLTALRDLPGVAEAEPSYTVEALTSTADEEFVLSVTSLMQNISTPHLVSGRLPETTEECLMDVKLEGAYALGDQVSLRSGSDDSLSDSLSSMEYTIVGFASNPTYLNFSRGAASIGNGSCSGLLYLLPECFLSDYYHTIYLTVEGGRDAVSYTEEYQDIIEPVITAVEDISGQRCELRYQEVVDEANEQLADAEAELADARREAETELGDAKTELTDAEAELADAKATLEEKEQELADGWQELADGEAELEEGRQKLAEGWGQYDSGLAQWQEQWDAFSSQKEALAAQQAAFQEKQNEFNQNESTIAAGFAELEAGEAALAAARAQLEQAELVYGPLPEQRQELEAQAAVLAATRQQLESAQAALEAARPELTAGAEQLSAAAAQIATGEEQLLAAKATLDASYQTLSSTQAEVDQAASDLEEARQTLADGEEQIAEARTEIADAETELADGWQEYEDARLEAEDKIADAEDEIAEARADLDELEEPEWYVLDRDSIQSYVEFGLDAERIGNIGKVFPAIFFLVAALVSLTTMTRMVEEERTQIGTLKALGYSQSAIAGKYMMYALSASVLGSILGVLAGSQILPQVIIAAYRMLYVTLTVSRSPIQPGYAILSMLIAVLCTTAATWAACHREFQASPAELMRPAAPKQGKRVLLERVTFFWRRLSFTGKATLRNLIRYKKRFFMTVFGIGGCMALLMVGFGLRDSIAKIMDNQYKTVYTYQASLGLDSEKDHQALTQLLEQRSGIPETLSIYQVNKEVKKGSVTKGAYLFVPESLDVLPDFVRLQSRQDHTPYTLDGDTAILTEKLARLLDVKVGDTFLLAESETESYEITVGAITENYLYHYVYLSPTLYKKIYGEAPAYNELLLRMEGWSEEEEHELSRELLARDEVLSVTYIHERQATVDDMMRSLDLVVWVLIVSAGLLAFVVLYNLNNINITERRRELATLKVLGFYDGEVAGYVYRENILLTILGIIAGIFLGIVLHRFVIQTVEVDMLMFGQVIQPPSYLYSSLLTALFSLLVNISMFYKLRSIDMIESLKSVE